MRNLYLMFCFAVGAFFMEIYGQTIVVDIESPKNKLNLDSSLRLENNSFLAELSGDELSLCCYDLIAIPLSLNYKIFAVKTEPYNLEGKLQKVKVYQHDSSFVKTYFNEHQNANETGLISGIIYNNKLFTYPQIKIGMTKDAILNKFFKPSITYKKVSRLTIYENEVGEALTTLIFKNNLLTEIHFDSSYDWIKKGQ